MYIGFGGMQLFYYHYSESSWTGMMYNEQWSYLEWGNGYVNEWQKPEASMCRKRKIWAGRRILQTIQIFNDQGTEKKNMLIVKKKKKKIWYI